VRQRSTAADSTVVEGGIVMALALDDPSSLKRQILAFRALVQALFVPIPEEGSWQSPEP
jgi:hypothetical protein